MPESSSFPDYVSLIISFRRPDLLQDVLNALSSQTHKPHHVVVVDNSGDLDESALEWGQFQGSHTVIRRPENPGYAAAANEARAMVERLGVGRLLVLTHDASFAPSLGESLISALEEDSRSGAVAPLLRWVSRPDDVFSAGGRLTRNGRAWNSTRPVSVDTPYLVDWVDGAIVMFRTEALDDIDWLDERYFLYFEDVDTSWRLARSGWSVLVDPRTQASQEPGAHPMYLGIRNMTMFGVLAEYPAWRTVAAVARRVAEESAYRLLHNRRPEIVQAFAGWRDGRKLLSGHPRIGG